MSGDALNAYGRIGDALRALSKFKAKPWFELEPGPIREASERYFVGKRMNNRLVWQKAIDDLSKLPWEVGLKAVSYTHLTLPTNREV